MKPDCDACQGIEPLTPETVASRPGLPALRYRAGTHGSFLESMIARLSVIGAEKAKAEAAASEAPRRGAQAQTGGGRWLRSREPADPTIAMLDAWATVGDIMTFYQERIANEGYLSTARERRSLHELAHQVGYKLRPALSSSVFLAFDVQPPPALDREVPPAPPHEVLIPKGTQARHIPGPGELPQVFETKEDLVARPEWNQLKPRLTKPTVIDVGSAYEAETIYVDGTESRLKPGEFVLFTFPDVAIDLGRRTLSNPVIRQVSSVTPEATEKRTRIDLVRTLLSLRAHKNGILQIASSMIALVNSTQPLPTTANRSVSFDGPINDLVRKTESSTSLVNADKVVSEWITTSGENNTTWSKCHSGYVNAKLLIDRFQNQAIIDAASFTHVTKGWQTLTTYCTNAVSYINTLTTMVKRLDDPQGEAPQVTLSNAKAALAAAAISLPEDTNKLRTRVLALNAQLITISTPALTKEEAKKEIWEGMCMPFPLPTTFDDLLSQLTSGKNQIDAAAQPLILPSAVPLNTKNEWDVHINLAKDIVDAPVDKSYWRGNTQVLLSLPFLDDFAKDAAKIAHKKRKLSLDAINAEHKTKSEELKNYQSVKDGVEEKDLSEVTSEIEAVVNTYEGVITAIRDFAWKSDGISRPNVDSFSLVTTFENVAHIEAARQKMIADLKASSAPALKVIVATLGELMVQRPDGVRVRIQSVITQLKALEIWPTPGNPSPPWSRLEKTQALLASLKVDEDDATRTVTKSLLERLSPSMQSSPASTAPSLPSVGSLDSVANVFGSILGDGAAGIGTDTLFQENSDLIVQMLEGFQPEIRGQLRREWKRREKRPEVEVTVFRSRSSLFGATSKGIQTPRSEQFFPIDHPAEDETLRQLFLEGEVAGIAPGGVVMVTDEVVSSDAVGLSFKLKPFIVDDAQVVERSAYEHLGKSTRIDLMQEWRDDEKKNFAKRLRSTLVWCASEQLKLVDGPLDVEFPEPLGSSATGTTEVRNSFLLDTTIDGLKANQYLMISGDFVLAGESKQRQDSSAAGTQNSRLARITAVENITNEGRLLTRITIFPAFQRQTTLESTPGWLKRSTVRIYANVVEATNGSTVEEVIGNGEGQGQFQRFLLSQPKLTYLPAETPVGMAPELEVRVNSVAWDRAETVAGLEPESGPTGMQPQLPRRYLSSVDDDERTFLTTGDGMTTGERLPTGITNVRAKYRVGGGRGGNVKEGTITQLASPPLNVIKVRNLMPASGGVDRENVDQARKNVPVAVMALDRLVSVADYESFARKFAGIAKAQATPLLLDGKNTVVVTIAGLDDIPIDRESLLYGNLVKALAKYADPEQAVLVEPRELLLLMTQLKIKLQPGYVFEEVEPRVKRRILDRFNFERAELGEDVLLSDLIETVQNTPGVKYVDVDMFDRMRQFYGTAQMVAHATKIQTGMKPAATLPPPASYVEQPLMQIEVEVTRKDDNEVVHDSDGKTSKVELPQRDPTSPKFFPAQLAYFADLAGTILVKEIK